MKRMATSEEILTLYYFKLAKKQFNQLKKVA